MKPISITAVGDISFGEHPVCLSYGVNSMLKEKPSINMFEHVEDILKKGDIVFGNLETVLSEYNLNERQAQSINMRGSKTAIKHLVGGGFNAINIANNHILQHGEGAFHETVDLLQEHKIGVIGLAEKNGFNCKPFVHKIKDQEIVFLGYAFEREPYFEGVTLYAQGMTEYVLEDIKKYKRNDNVVICSFHWGHEFINYPSYKQTQFARRCIETGCDLILGHHPHVLQSYEFYNGKYIFYSLGNFLFDMLWSDDLRKSMILELRVNGDIDIEEMYPIEINKDYQPVYLKNKNFKEEFSELSKNLNKKSLNSDDNSYAIEFEKFEKQNRYRSWRHLMKNLLRYNPGILLQIIFKTITRRLHEFSLKQRRFFMGSLKNQEK